MPTLDDTTTLVKNVAIAANDSLVISNKDSGASSLIQQVPAAQILGGYSHAWLFNFDSASYAVDATSTTVDLLTFSSTHRVDKAAVVVTKAFNPSGTAVIDVGIQDEDLDDYIDNLDMKTVGITKNSGDAIETPAEDAASAVSDPTDADLLRVTFTNGGSQNLSTATTGQLVLLVNVIDINDYVDLIPAQ
tara:strand:- start:841 stop:1410 length:570 start_codon:yes stop_codon:yes gene_type:complete